MQKSPRAYTPDELIAFLPSRIDCDRRQDTYLALIGAQPTTPEEVEAIIERVRSTYINRANRSHRWTGEGDVEAATYEADGLRSLISAVMNELEQADRDLLAREYIDEISVRECARWLHITEKTYRKHREAALLRARAIAITRGLKIAA